MLRSHCGLRTLHVSGTHVENIINGTRDSDLVGIRKGLDHFHCNICFYVVLKVRILSQIWKKFANMRFL